MRNRKWLQDIDSLRQYFIHSKIKIIYKNRKRFYQLSVLIDNEEIILKNSTKKIIHSSFDNVIHGAFKRMEKLFDTSTLDLGVIINSYPTKNNLSLSFELVNKNKFLINNEEYYLSIIAEYSYNRMAIVTYYPIIYREVCENGNVVMLSKKFIEYISADKTYDIGYEWSRCNFEDYKNKVSEYFENIDFIPTYFDMDNGIDNIKISITNLVEKILKIKINPDEYLNEIIDEINTSPKQRLENLMQDNFRRMDYSNFGFWNVITAFSSQEEDFNKRNKMFLNSGKFLYQEINKNYNRNRKFLIDYLSWNDIQKIAHKL
jgi:hypothetical protein